LEGEANFSCLGAHEALPKATLYGVVFQKLNGPLLTSGHDPRSGDQFVIWGWRIPFALSIVLVGIGLWIRLGILETQKPGLCLRVDRGRGQVVVRTSLDAKRLGLRSLHGGLRALREHLELVTTSRSATPNKTDLSCQLIAEQGPRDQVGAAPGIVQTKCRSPPRQAHLDEGSTDPIVRARGGYWRGRAAESGRPLQWDARAVRGRCQLGSNGGFLSRFITGLPSQEFI
jgi:hypothetical protein